MKLTGFTITNHARLTGDVHLRVRKGALVLVGANGSGKTAIMRCLDLTLGAAPEELAMRIDTRDIHDPTRPMRVECDFNSLTDDEKHLFDEATIEDTLRIRLEAMTTDSEESGVQIRRWLVGRNNKKEHLIHPTDKQIAAFGWRFASARRHGPEILTRDRDVAIAVHRRQHGLPTPGDIYLANVENTLMDGDTPLDESTRHLLENSHNRLDRAMASDKGLATRRNQLAGELSTVFTRHFTTSDIAFTHLRDNRPNSSGQIRLHLRPDENEDAEQRNVTDMVARIFLAAHSATTFAIDEPELHLSPTVQRVLARTLAHECRNSLIQCIIATHSADIAGEFDPESTAVMSEGTVRQPDEGFLDETSNAAIRAHWWRADRLDALTARAVILVEGITDRMIVERAARERGQDLDRLGIALVQTDGVGKMVPFATVFGSSGFDVPVYRLIDSDAVASAAASAGLDGADLTVVKAGGEGASRSRLIARLREQGVFVSEPDLEGEYVAAFGAEAVACALKNRKLEEAVAEASGDLVRQSVLVADQCRHQKVDAALAVLPLITRDSVCKIKSVACLLDALFDRL